MIPPGPASMDAGRRCSTSCCCLSCCAPPASSMEYLPDAPSRGGRGRVAAKPAASSREKRVPAAPSRGGRGPVTRAEGGAGVLSLLAAALKEAEAWRDAMDGVKAAAPVVGGGSALRKEKRRALAPDTTAQGGEGGAGKI